MRRGNVLLVIAAGLSSAALSYLGTGLHPMWPLLWLAPIPLLAIAPRLRASAAFLLAFVAWLIGEMNQWNYLTRAIDLPLPLIALALVIPAIVFGLGVLFTRCFLLRGSLFLGSLAFPVYWVACEYLTEIGSPHSTWGNLAYTQMNFLPIIQIASITGIWGISFIVFLFAGTVATLLSGVGEPPQSRALAITVGVVILALFLFGEWRLGTNPSPKSCPVTLRTKYVPLSVYLGPEDQALELLRQYADEVRHATPAGTPGSCAPGKNRACP